MPLTRGAHSTPLVRFWNWVDPAAVPLRSAALELIVELAKDGLDPVERRFAWFGRFEVVDSAPSPLSAERNLSVRRNSGARKLHP